MILIIILYALLAAAFTIAKVSVAYANPFFLIGFRMILAGSSLLGYYWCTQKRLHIAKADYGLFAQVALFHVYLAFVPEFWALQYMASVKVNLMYAITPFVSAILSYFLLQERLRWRQRVGIIAAFIALLPVLLNQGDAAFEVAALYRISWPEVMLLLSIMSAAYAWFIIKKLMNKKYSLIFINGFAMLMGGLASFTTWALAKHADIITGPAVYDWQLFLFYVTILIILSNFVVYNLYGWLMHHYSITLITMAGFLCPIFGAAYGALFLHESLSWHYLVATAGIAFGLWLFHGKREVHIET